MNITNKRACSILSFFLIIITSLSACNGIEDDITSFVAIDPATLVKNGGKEISKEISDGPSCCTVIKVLRKALNTGWYLGNYAGRTFLVDRTQKINCDVSGYNCDPTHAICDKGVFKFVQTNKIQPESTLMATVKNRNKKVQLYKSDELLGAVPNAVATLSIGSQSKSAIVYQISGGFLEIKLDPTSFNVRHEITEEVDVNIIIIASQHALSLANFNHWDGNWKTNPVDRFLRRKITWVSISDDATIKKGGEFDSFKKLSGLAKKDSRMVAKLKRTKVLLNLSQYLSTSLTRKVDYLIFIKDKWSAYHGIDDFIDEINKLGIPIDIFSTKTDSAGRYVFDALIGETGGIYRESFKRDRIVFNDLNISSRINDKLRTRITRSLRTQGRDLWEEAIFIVKENEAAFEITNNLLHNHAQTMLAVLKLLSCLAENPQTVSQTLRESMTALGLAYKQDEKPLKQLFEEWFFGYKLSISSPLADKNLVDIVFDAGDTSSKVYQTLTNAIISLEKITESDTRRTWCEVHEVPYDIFSLPKGQKRQTRRFVPTKHRVGL